MAPRLPAFAVLLLAAACGSSGARTVTAPPRTVTVTVTTTPAGATQPGTTSPAGPTVRAPATSPARLTRLCGAKPACDDFRTPTGNIVCFATARAGGSVECDIKSGLVPAPQRAGCDLDQPGLWLPAAGAGRTACRSDPTPAWLDPGIPALAYGSTWLGYGTMCLSQTSGLRCTNAAGHGFTLARGRWSAF